LFRPEFVDQTLYLWRATYPEFSEAMKSGKSLADDRVERSLYQRAWGYEVDIKKTVIKKEGRDVVTTTTEFREHIPGDVTAQTRWLAHRRPKQWRGDMPERPKTLAPPDRGQSQRAECGDIDRLAVHHARLERLYLQGGGREAAHQPKLDLRSRPPMSATKALTRSRKRRAVAERPSRPGNRSLWFVTAERVRDENSSEGDDMASISSAS
jgi:hypothetical protein